MEELLENSAKHTALGGSFSSSWLLIHKEELDHCILNPYCPARIGTSHGMLPEISTEFSLHTWHTMHCMEKCLFLLFFLFRKNKKTTEGRSEINTVSTQPQACECRGSDSRNMS